MDHSKDLRLVIISGLSGSGKTHALKCFEDLGFFCMDNLPPLLLPVFADLCGQSNREIQKVAVGIDIRERGFLRDYMKVAEQMEKRGYRYELVFFEAEDPVLIRRFSETRRPHPLAGDGPIQKGIELEKEQLKDLRKGADRIINTSGYTIHELKAALTQFYLDPGESRRPRISLISFGYKYGIPYETDLVFDVRFLQNPHFVSELRPLSGLEPPVVEYVFKSPEADQFVKQIKDMIHFLTPLFEREGRRYFTISLGCTGGRHRSVAVTGRLRELLKTDGYEIRVTHRDVDRDR